MTPKPGCRRARYGRRIPNDPKTAMSATPPARARGEGDARCSIARTRAVMVATTATKLFNDISLFKALTVLSLSALLRRRWRAEILWRHAALARPAKRQQRLRLVGGRFCAAKDLATRSASVKRRIELAGLVRLREGRPRTIAERHGKSRDRRRATRRIAGLTLILAVLGSALLGSASVGYRSAGGPRSRIHDLAGLSVRGGDRRHRRAIGLAVAVMARHWASVAATILATLLRRVLPRCLSCMQLTGRSVPASTTSRRTPRIRRNSWRLRSLRERTPNGVAYGGPAVAGRAEAGIPGSGAPQPSSVT